MDAKNVEESSVIITTFIDDLGEDLEETTLENLIDSIDNVNTYTEEEEIRGTQQSADSFRNSSISVSRGVARVYPEGVLIDEATVGK